MQYAVSSQRQGALTLGELPRLFGRTLRPQENHRQITGRKENRHAKPSQINRSTCRTPGIVTGDWRRDNATASAVPTQCEGLEYQTANDISTTARKLSRETDSGRGVQHSGTDGARGAKSPPD